ncbi:hypothetical protein GGR51DRAFT_508121 [Nemania sp. FL0031]|nr:hypothetical protein GGR51DRAFT_508121 [Nemania sp. FL0031]
MARLNEPTVSTDNLEALRRRFLRQNRDIARTNSTQSLKIRNLENECARLLSENLQLRSEILRLNKELEGSHAHRVANHALQIKEKMEAQLLEWGAMLADLGHEPVPKNRSPRALKKAKLQRNSIGRTRTSDWRRRETMGSMEDLEAAALQEGRLPPLWENKTYPRETLNRDDILALCSEAEESTDSPDIGPPPVSRFVDEDPVKLDLSTLTKLLTPALTESDTSGPEDSYPSSPTASIKTHKIIQKTPEGDQAERAEEDTKSTPESGPQSPVQTAKANLKRKIREEDEKENAPLSKPLLPASTMAKNQPEKISNEKANATNRPIKELPAGKRDSREKSSNTTQRKPLGAKSSNEALSSLKKSAKAPAEGKGAKPKAEGKHDELAKGHLKPQKEPKTIDILPPCSPEPVSRVDIEPESLSAEPNLAVPDSPEASVPREKINDTPPPVDISSKGETTRGNRRARAAVSYAEPNLRDKMRRPNTKQLFDAVAGEGKNIRRTSQYQKEEPPSGPFSGTKSESSRKNATLQPASHDIRSDPDIMASPLVQKTTRTFTLDELPATITTDRKRKDSATAAQDHKIETITKGANRRLEQIAAREAEVAELFERSDVYEFTDSSLLNDTSQETTPEGENKTTKGGRQSRSRRFSSVTPEGLQLSNTNQNEKAPSKQTGSRKRASMAAIKSIKSDLDDSRGESPSVDGDSVSSAEGDRTTREKTSSRRRTTMI